MKTEPTEKENGDIVVIDAQPAADCSPRGLGRLRSIEALAIDAERNDGQLKLGFQPAAGFAPQLSSSRLIAVFAA